MNRSIPSILPGLASLRRLLQNFVLRLSEFDQKSCWPCKASRCGKGMDILDWIYDTYANCKHSDKHDRAFCTVISTEELCDGWLDERENKHVLLELQTDKTWNDLVRHTVVIIDGSN